MPTAVVGRCGCGKCTVRQRVPGGITGGWFKCHCSKCRKRTIEQNEENAGKFAGNVIDWCCNLSTSGSVQTTRTGTAVHLCCCTLPSWFGGLDSNRCSECNQYVSFAGWGAFTGIAGANMQVINRGLPEERKLKPIANIFYDSGLKEGEEGLPTAYSDEKSLVLWMKTVLSGICCNCSNNCCCIPAKVDKYAPMQSFDAAAPHQA